MSIAVSFLDALSTWSALASMLGLLVPGKVLSLFLQEWDGSVVFQKNPTEHVSLQGNRPNLLITITLLRPTKHFKRCWDD